VIVLFPWGGNWADDRAGLSAGDGIENVNEANLLDCINLSVGVKDVKHFWAGRDKGFAS
jgi:hypothetical protein